MSWSCRLRTWSAVLLSGVIGGLWGGQTLVGADDPLQRFEFAEPHLGTQVQFVVYAPEEAAANRAAQKAYQRINDLDLVFSDYKSESEVQRLCAAAVPGQPASVSAELFELLTTAQTIAAESEGAFDVSLGKLTRLWRRARRQRQLPPADQLKAARETVGFRQVSTDPQNRTVTFAKPGIALDFGGIAKGYIAEQAYRELEQAGLPRSLVAVAGDIFAGDPPPGTEGWRVGVTILEPPHEPPQRFLRLKRMAVSTSGDVYQFLELDGVRYSHILDPQTGIGLTERRGTTIIAPHGALADGLATAVTVLGAERGLKLMALHPEAAALHVRHDGEQIVAVPTENWREWLIDASQSPTP